MTNTSPPPVEVAPTSRILQKPDIVDLRPRITVFGVGGGGGNAVNNMISAGLEGVEFVVANTDSQSLKMSRAERKIQLGVNVTAGLGAGSNPEIGQAAAEECLHEILDQIGDSHMVFITCGMGGGTGTGAAPVIARAARERGLLTVGVVTKPFNFERPRRMKLANAGIEELQKHVDTLIVIPNQNLFRIANENTSLVDAFAMADQVLYAGVASITDLMVREGLLNLDFADVRSVMLNMGRAMMGTGEASGEGRALAAAEAAIANPLLDESSMHGARGLLISITGGRDMTLNEVDVAVTRVCEDIDPEANVIFGAILDDALEGTIRVSVVATGIDNDGETAVYTPTTIGGAGVSGSQSLSSKPVDRSEPSASATTSSVANADLQDFNIDVMDALEEEIAGSLEDDFRPQSQIFAQVTPEIAMKEASVQETMVREAMVREATVAARQEIPASVAAPNRPNRQDEASHVAAADDLRNRVPDLEDFPPSIQQAVGRKVEESEMAGHGPRWLLKKITQGFVQRDGEDPVVRLEPAEIVRDNAPALVEKPAPVSTVGGQAGQVVQPAPSLSVPPKRPDLFQGFSRATPQLAKSQPQPVATKGGELSDEELEIPPFLRRQVS